VEKVGAPSLFTVGAADVKTDVLPHINFQPTAYWHTRHIRMLISPISSIVETELGAATRKIRFRSPDKFIIEFECAVKKLSSFQ
jgi:hypothetical protein